MFQHIRKLFGRQRTNPSRPNWCRPLPELQALEDRTTPSTGWVPLQGDIQHRDLTHLSRSLAYSDVGTVARVFQGSSAIGVQLFSWNGKLMKMFAVPATYSTAINALPTIAMASNGRFVIAWTHNTVSGGSSNLDVWGQIYNPSGVAVGKTLRVTTATDHEFDPQVGMDRQGNFIVGYQRNYGGTSDSAIYVKRYDLWGHYRGFVSETAATGTLCHPALDMNASGRFVVAYTNTNGTQGDVWASTYAASGGKIATSSIAGSTANEDWASVAIDAWGNFTVAYERTSGGNQYLGMQHLNPSMTEIGLYPIGSTLARLPSVDMAADGRLVVAWHTMVGSQYDVHAQVYTATGALRGTTFSIVAAPYNEGCSTVTVNTNGGFSVDWLAFPPGQNYPFHRGRLYHL